MSDRTDEHGLDDDGYPTEKTLDTLRNWDVLDFKGVAHFLLQFWRYPEYIKHYKYRGKQRLKISTGGWSGNEDLLSALPPAFDSFYLLQYRRGGHFLYEDVRT